ncbi:MAG TPA: hypothetical protein VGM27_07935 [Acidobacteriaceae bacterium]
MRVARAILLNSKHSFQQSFALAQTHAQHFHRQFYPLDRRRDAEDLRALTPSFHGHINPYGQFALDRAPFIP